MPRVGLAALLALLAASATARAQMAPAPDPQTLAKYDTNKNGQLDADELVALRAAEEKAIVAVNSLPKAAVSDEVVALSPFEVNADNDKGYYAANTLSGTRINTKLEDIGASISVVTKQQMEDFAMLDINDVFLYEASTEGTGTYTDVVIDRNGIATDNVARDPNNANRVRGIGPANQAFGNFQTGVPIDPAMVDSLEISRGPNSSIWGLGNGSGTVNAVPSAANVQREATSVSLRTDNLGSVRTVLDFNRPLIRNKLAIRGMAVYQEDEYVRQPSFSRTNRYDGMITYKPFKNTTIRGAFEHYENYSRRPNSILPRDGLSYWEQSGRPTWDASTWTLTRQGVQTVVPYATSTGPENTLLGAGVESVGTNLARSILFVDNGQIPLWTTGYISSINTTTGIASPDSHANSGHQRFIETAPAPRVGPLAATWTSITDRSVYDWSGPNIGAANWNQNKTNSYTVQLEQFFINTPRNLVAAQFGWHREQSNNYSRSFIGTSGSAAMIIYMDNATKLPDGRVNPFFGRPYTNATEPTIGKSQPLSDEYKSQLVYRLTLSKDHNWVRWLGDHTLSGYNEYKRSLRASYSFRDVIIDDHAWLPAGAARYNGATVARGYYRYYLGDNQGENIDYGPAAWYKASGVYPLHWYNAQLGQWVDEPARIGEAFGQGNDVSANVIKTVGGVLQSHLLDDRLVTTFGLRRDSNFNRNAAQTLVNADGVTPNYSSDDTWPNNWFRRDGRTKTSEVVFRPFRKWNFLDRRAEDGAGLVRYVADFVRSINVYYNRSDSFIPQTTAQNLNLVLLPNPTSLGKDYGFSFGLFEKLFVRVNHYENGQVNSRTGDAGTIATRTGRLDFAFAGNNDQFNLQRQAAAWIAAASPTFTQDQINTEVAKVMQVPLDRLAQMNAYPIAETSDVLSKGDEIELTYNPNRFWTVRANVTHQQTVEENVTPGIQEYIDNRMPVWTSIIDPRTNTPWWTTRYGSAGTAVDFFNGNVVGPYKLLRATEGKSRPQIRQWNFKGATNYSLRGLGIENKWLQRVSVSGALRWESVGGIGYYTYDNDPNSYDPSKVIYDKAHLYCDLGASYSTRIYRDKVGLRVQINARNVGENGRIQPVGALPNGVPHTFRIVDPATYILTATFSL
jgi:hypothetical protein